MTRDRFISALARDQSVGYIDWVTHRFGVESKSTVAYRLTDLPIIKLDSR